MLSNRLLLIKIMCLHQDLKKTLRELRNENNVFEVKSGKSCLFTSELKILCSQLQCTPVYVLVTDNFTKVPILVANSCVCFSIQHILISMLIILF